jgi:hypothetical protein
MLLKVVRVEHHKAFETWNVTVTVEEVIQSALEVRRDGRYMEH